MTAKIVSIILCAIPVVLGFALWADNEFGCGRLDLSPPIIFCLGLVGLAIVLALPTKRE